MHSKKHFTKSKYSKSVTENKTRFIPSIHPVSIPTSPKESGPPEKSLPEVQADFAELENGALAELIEDPVDSNRTMFAIFNRGRVRLARRVEDRGRILVPMSRDTLGLSDVKLPRGVLPYMYAKRLAYSIRRFIHSAVDVPFEYELLLSAYIMYSWVADRLPTAVYLSVIGLPQSGKSTMLEVLSMVSRRGLLVHDISQAAAYRACSNFNPTLLIDEVEWRTSTSMTALRQLLRAGTNPSALALRVRQSSSCFGPKVFGSLEPSPDSALNSRCILLSMGETDKSGLLKPSHPSMTKLADDLRQRLLRFRFNFYKTIQPAVIPGEGALRPRSRDILSCLAAPLVGSKSYSEFLLSYMKFKHDPVTQESLEPRHEALLAALWEVIHREPPVLGVRIGGEMGLRRVTNEFLQAGGERLTVTDKGTGTMVSSMGIRSTERTKTGWILVFDSPTLERCHHLMKKHHNRYVQSPVFAQYSGTCSFCKAIAAATET